jgi:hypothetical protein
MCGQTLVEDARFFEELAKQIAAISRCWALLSCSDIALMSALKQVDMGRVAELCMGPDV